MTGDTSYADWEITSAEPASAYVKEYSDFFALMDDMAEGEAAFAENFEIDGAYAVRMKTAGSTDVSTSSDETDSINFDFNISGNYDIDMDMPIIHINGQWKCDPVVSMAMSLYNMFSDMADSLSEAE